MTLWEICVLNPNFQKGLPDDHRTSRNTPGPNSTPDNPAAMTRAPQISPDAPKRMSQDPENLPEGHPVVLYLKVKEEPGELSGEPGGVCPAPLVVFGLAASRLS